MTQREVGDTCYKQRSGRVAGEQIRDRRWDKRAALRNPAKTGCLTAMLVGPRLASHTCRYALGQHIHGSPINSASISRIALVLMPMLMFMLDPEACQPSQRFGPGLSEICPNSTFDGNATTGEPLPRRRDLAKLAIDETGRLLSSIIIIIAFSIVAECNVFANLLDKEIRVEEQLSVIAVGCSTNQEHG